MEKFNMYVILSAAISIDGKISTRSNDSKLSSQEDSIRLHKLRSKVDAILIGKNTLLQAVSYTHLTLPTSDLV